MFAPPSRAELLLAVQHSISVLSRSRVFNLGGIFSFGLVRMRFSCRPPALAMRPGGTQVDQSIYSLRLLAFVYSLFATYYSLKSPHQLVRYSLLSESFAAATFVTRMFAPSY